MNRLLYMILLICVLLLPTSLLGQEVSYSHPLHNISFEATPSWDQKLHENNGKVFEVTNPNNNMHIYLSFVPECRNVKKHMKRISGRNGLVCQGRPHDSVLNQMEVVVMQGSCVQGKEPFRKMLIGIPGNNGLYLMEISCPNECYVNHKDQVQSILTSLKVEV